MTAQDATVSNVAVPFSARLRDETREDHERTESSPFVTAYLAGRVPDRRLRGSPGPAAGPSTRPWSRPRPAPGRSRRGPVPRSAAGPLALPRRGPAPARRRRLAATGSGPARRPRAHAERIRELARTWPGGFIAHHYIRYLGDLSGGRALGSKARKLYQLDDDGVRFYRFDDIASPTEFKDGYRRLLDAAPWSAGRAGTHRGRGADRLPVDRGHVRGARPDGRRERRRLTPSLLAMSSSGPVPVSRARLVALAVVVMALVVGVLVGGLLVLGPVAAQGTAEGSAGQTLSVSRTTGLDPAGEVVTVSGSGYDETKGIYVSFCVLPPPGQKPTPCAGGIDLTGSAAAPSGSPPTRPRTPAGLTTPFGPGGTFEVDITLAAALADGYRLPGHRLRRRDPCRPHAGGRPLGGRVRARVVRGPAHRGRACPARVPAGCRRRPAAVGRRAQACGPVTASVDDVIRPARRPCRSPVLPVTVTDADGRPVTVTDVERILPVNLYGSIAEIVFSLGLGDRVIGRDTSTTFPDAADLPLVTVNGHDLSAEAILELDPSVVLADASIGPGEVFDQLRAAGVTGGHARRAADASRMCPGTSGRSPAALGVAEAGERLIARTQQEIETAIEAVGGTSGRAVDRVPVPPGTGRHLPHHRGRGRTRRDDRGHRRS